jgi:RNA polymerase sigma factor (sigma-70 family)
MMSSAGRSPDQPDDQAHDWLGIRAKAAANGDRHALEDVCKGLQDLIYRLALRSFSDPADAADATQEALIRIVTNLSSFEGRSKLTTWAYTIAARQFLRMRMTRVEETVGGPDQFGEWVDAHRQEPSAELASSVEFEQLSGDVRISCTYGMLLCLSREQRIAYLLGDVIGFTDQEGAIACEITPAAFRQRLSRARSTMRDLMASRCGLVRASNPCRCRLLVEASISNGLLDPVNPTFARHGGADIPIVSSVLAVAANELDHAVAIAEVFRSDPQWSAPGMVWQHLTEAMPALLGPDPGLALT